MTFTPSHPTPTPPPSKKKITRNLKSSTRRPSWVACEPSVLQFARQTQLAPSHPIPSRPSEPTRKFLPRVINASDGRTGTGTGVPSSSAAWLCPCGVYFFFLFFFSVAFFVFLHFILFYILSCILVGLGPRRTIFFFPLQRKKKEKKKKRRWCRGSPVVCSPSIHHPWFLGPRELACLHKAAIRESMGSQSGYAIPLHPESYGLLYIRTGPASPAEGREGGGGLKIYA